MSLWNGGDVIVVAVFHDIIYIGGIKFARGGAICAQIRVPSAGMTKDEQEKGLQLLAAQGRIIRRAVSIKTARMQMHKRRMINCRRLSYWT